MFGYALGIYFHLILGDCVLGKEFECEEVMFVYVLEETICNVVVKSCLKTSEKKYFEEKFENNVCFCSLSFSKDIF